MAHRIKQRAIHPTDTRQHQRIALIALALVLINPPAPCTDWIQSLPSPTPPGNDSPMGYAFPPPSPPTPRGNAQSALPEKLDHEEDCLPPPLRLCHPAHKTGAA